MNYAIETEYTLAIPTNFVTRAIMMYVRAGPHRPVGLVTKRPQDAGSGSLISGKPALDASACLRLLARHA